MVIKEFFAKLGLKIDESSFAKGKVIVEGVKKALVAFGAAAIAGGTALGLMAVDAANDAAEINKLAQILGVSREKAQEFAQAFGSFGVDIDQFTDLMAELGENIGEASEGTGEAADAFKSLKIKIKDAKGELRATDEVLLEIAEKMAALPDGTKKTAALTGLFGESGIKLITALNQGPDAIRAMMEQARAMGLVMDEEAVKKGAEFSQQWLDLKSVFHSLKQTIAGAFIPALSELTEEFFEWYKVNKDFVKLALNKVFQAIVIPVKALWELFKLINGILSFLSENFKALAIVLGGVLLAALVANASAIWSVVAGYIAAGVSAVAAAGAAALAWLAAAAPVIALAALFAAILLILEDIWVWLNGGKSLIGELWDKWKGFLDDWSQPQEGDHWMVSILKWMYRMINEVLPAAWDALVEKFKIAAHMVQSVVDTIDEYIVDPVVGSINEYIVDPVVGSVNEYIADPIADFINEYIAEDEKKLFVEAKARGDHGTIMKRAKDFVINYVAPKFGNGSSPQASVSANKITQNTNVNAPITIQVTQQAGEDPKGLVQRIGEEVDNKLRGLFRETFVGASG